MKPDRFEKSLLFTVAVLASYCVARLVPIPGVDAPPETAFGTGVFALGLKPYIAASVVIVLLAGAVPRLRRLRDGPSDQAAGLDRYIYAVAIALALLQAYGRALWLELVALVAPQSVLFRMQSVVIIAGGAILLAWLADQVTRRQLVNGVVLIALADGVINMASGLVGEIHTLTRDGLLRERFFLLVVLVALFVLSVYMVTTGRRVPLRTIDEGAWQAGDARPAPELVLRANMVGIVPLIVASMVMLPLNYVAIRSGSVASVILYAVLIVFFTYVWTAITFSGADLVTRAQRYGYALAGPEDAEAPADYIDGIVERLTARHAAFLVGLAVAVPLALNKLGVGHRFAWALGPSLLVIAATGFAIWENIRAHRRTQGIWTPVFTADTALEVDLAIHILQRAGIPAMRRSSRVIPITGALGYWETCRPPYPSLAIHRYLSGGRVYAEVPVEQAHQSETVLAPYRQALAV